MPDRLLERVGGMRIMLVEWHVSLHAAAVLRIGYGTLYFAFLLNEYPHRDELWGPEAPWTPALARQLFDQTSWISFLTLSDDPLYFELCYGAALLISLLFAAGWRTRATSLLFALVVTSFHARAIFSTDGGDNIVLLMAVYLCFTACGRRWSLDARRACRARGRGTAKRNLSLAPWLRELETARRQVTTLLHNCGMFVIAAQICIVYGAAGLYKVQGNTWGNGTALHYVTHLDLFQPWPALSGLASEHLQLLALAGYMAVLLQVSFPFVLFGRLKYPVLVMTLAMHLGIAVLMGLPFFSGAMLIADAVFLPDRFYRAAEARLHSLRRRTNTEDAVTTPTKTTSVPAQHLPETQTPAAGDPARTSR
ncbi:HTTM domain-containing protein [Streptomyces sp. 184]|uniref:HTTM domain-containing protein n=1 Tax=Streptomyces sp. 184 TaxID=1827526 RepID=UPI0038913A72